MKANQKKMIIVALLILEILAGCSVKKNEKINLDKEKVVETEDLSGLKIYEKIHKKVIWKKIE